MGELGTQKQLFQESITNEKAESEKSLTAHEEQERARREKVQQLQHGQEELQRRQELLKLKCLQGIASREDEDELQRIEESLRWKRAEQEMLESEDVTHKDITDQRELEMRIGKSNLYSVN